MLQKKVCENSDNDHRGDNKTKIVFDKLAYIITSYTWIQLLMIINLSCWCSYTDQKAHKRTINGLWTKEEFISQLPGKYGNKKLCNS